MDTVKQLWGFLILTVLSLCFIHTHFRFYSQPSITASAPVKDIEVAQSNKSKTDYKMSFLNDAANDRFSANPITIDKGLRTLLSFYEKSCGEKIPKTSAIENPYGTEDGYILFALENGMIDLYTLQALDKPMRHHQAASMIYALLNRQDMEHVDKTCINMSHEIVDILPYSDLYSKVSVLCGLGIINCSKYGTFEPDMYVTEHYLSQLMLRMENVNRRKHHLCDVQRVNATPFKAVLQKPELPTGCEVTSLTAVLNHIGINVDKCTLADDFLDKGQVGKTDPHRAFVGNPRKSNSFGCFSPVIVNCANKYLSSVNSPYRAYDISGKELSELISLTQKNTPVIIWATISMVKSYPANVWTIGTNKVSWIAEEHCMVLHGYNSETDRVLVADPLKGNVEYPRELFETRYNELLQQAVVIK